MLEKVMEIIENGEYECYGIRGDYESIYKVGDTCSNSHQWWQDSEDAENMGLTDDDYDESMMAWDGGELDGTCAVQITEDDDIESIIEMAKCHGGNIVLIAGNCFECGNDYKEVVIEEAQVIAVL